MTPNGFWIEPAEALIARLGSSPAGLAADEAALRLRREGPNHPQATHSTRLPRRLLRRLAEPLTAILLVAAVATGLRDRLRTPAGSAPRVFSAPAA